MVVRKPTYKTWWLDFQGIETIHINHHTAMPLATLQGLVLPYCVSFWGSKNNGNGCRTNAVKRKVVWVLSWRLTVATVGNFRWVEVFQGGPRIQTSTLQRCCFCSKGTKASNCAFSRLAEIFNHSKSSISRQHVFQRLVSNLETHTSFKFKMNVAAPLTSRFAGHLPSFPLQLRRWIWGVKAAETKLRAASGLPFRVGKNDAVSLGWPWHKKWWVEVQDGPLTR